MSNETHKHLQTTAATALTHARSKLAERDVHRFDGNFSEFTTANPTKMDSSRTAKAVEHEKLSARAKAYKSQQKGSFT